ncbi:RNA polymerase sigma factor [Sorangium sp. So ce124]|uniref:RNA polymerase sigma factor n=1 Tax=Sorangium sp. So ce124 TaxID=3133280 RepID=UPI003F629F9D
MGERSRASHLEDVGVRHEVRVLFDAIVQHSLPDPAPDAFASMEADSIRTGAIDAVNELDPQLRFVLRAHDLDGIPMAQVAEDAGLPLSTLYKRRTKALGALRDCRSPRARHEPQRDPRGRRRG